MLKALYTYVTTDMWNQIHPTTVMVTGFAVMCVIVVATRLIAVKPTRK